MANPIKQKFIEHMELYRLSKETQKGYISGVRCLKLHQAREELASVRFLQQPIADIAKVISFWHLGQFAHDYRKLFGILPSQTRSKADFRLEVKL